MNPDEPQIPIVPGPPPQVVYVYQQPTQSSAAVSGGIWSFVFQFWYVVAGLFVFMALCCLGVVLLGAFGSSH